MLQFTNISAPKTSVRCPRNLKNKIYSMEIKKCLNDFQKTSINVWVCKRVLGVCQKYPNHEPHDFIVKDSLWLVVPRSQEIVFVLAKCAEYFTYVWSEDPLTQRVQFFCECQSVWVFVFQNSDLPQVNTDVNSAAPSFSCQCNREQRFRET